MHQHMRCMVREMRSPIPSIHPYVPALEQRGEVICSMVSHGGCDHILIAVVRPEFSDGTSPRRRVCDEWLPSHPAAIAHITARGFQEPVIC
ncbi:hypothetical protein [Streptomyces sp. NBC_01314]|uniref:hypothetical protein n=1 Tax=Streptomyces sp. NBC_01314 TaxID=2903821 RepID=UPI00308DE97D|nr:hypothetical protein OG622_35785 [Streptomyces sp. NBC_01314]